LAIIIWQSIDEMTTYISKPPNQRDLVITHPRSYSSGHLLGLHAHAQAQLLYSASGLMNVTTPIGRFLVPSHRAVWIPPQIDHSVGVLADIEMRSVYLEKSWLDRQSKSPQLRHVFVIEVNRLLRELILAAHAEDATRERIELLMQLAIMELLTAKKATTFLPMPIDPRAMIVANLVLKDTKFEKTFEQFCSVANASGRTITRLFADETKLNFREWRQRARIMKAVEFLANKDYSIKQIALSLGFSSTAAFTHAFKEVMDVTPSEFAACK